jgi:hypothetical protein
MRDQGLRSSSARVATLVLAFAVRVLGHPLTDGMNALTGRKLPTFLRAKLHTTARKPQHAAYPAEMPKLRRTQEFPEIVCIGRYTPICWMTTSRPQHQPDLPQPRPEAATADQRACLQQALPGQETANQKRQTDPIPGGGGPERRRRPRTEGTGASSRSCSPWSAPGPHAIQNPWSAPGTSGRGRRTRTAGHTAFTAPGLGRPSSMRPGSSPSSNTAPGT